MDAGLKALIMESMPPEGQAEYVAKVAQDVVRFADELGVAVRINRVPVEPLAMGRARHVVEAWPARVMAPVQDRAFDVDAACAAAMQRLRDRIDLDAARHLKAVRADIQQSRRRKALSAALDFLNRAVAGGSAYDHFKELVSSGAEPAYWSDGVVLGDVAVMTGFPSLHPGEEIKPVRLNLRGIV